MPMQPAITVRYSAQRRRRASPTASVSSSAAKSSAPIPVSSTVRVENWPMGRGTQEVNGQRNDDARLTQTGLEFGGHHPWMAEGHYAGTFRWQHRFEHQLVAAAGQLVT